MVLFMPAMMMVIMMLSMSFAMSFAMMDDSLAVIVLQFVNFITVLIQLEFQFFAFITTQMTIFVEFTSKN